MPRSSPSCGVRHRTDKHTTYPTVKTQYYITGKKLPERGVFCSFREKSWTFLGFLIRRVFLFLTVLPLPLGEVAERSEDGEGKP